MRIRPTARVIVLDDQQRVLLFHIHDRRPLHKEYPNMTLYWITPGGGVEPGETFEQAATRELWEETGIQVQTVGPCVWHYGRILQLEEETLHLQERFFIVTVATSLVTMTQMLPYEHETHLTYHWWQLDALACSQESFLPPALPRLLQTLLNGDIPAEPIQL